MSKMTERAIRSNSCWKRYGQSKPAKAFGGGRDTGRAGTVDFQLVESRAGRQAVPRRHEVAKPEAEGTVEAARRCRTPEDEARYVCVRREGVNVMYAFIERNHRHWPISVLYKVLDLSSRGFHQRRQRTSQEKPPRSCLSDDALLCILRQFTRGQRTMWLAAHMKRLDCASRARGRIACLQADGAA